MDASYLIINTKVVDNTIDSFWEDIARVIVDLIPKSILVLVNTLDPNGNEEMLLLKMMEACKLSKEQYNIVQLEPGKNISWHKLRDSLQPKVVFLFGVHPMQLGISALFCRNEPNRFNDCVFIPSTTLKEIENNKELKRSLWLTCMEPVFISKQYGKI